MVVRYVNRLKLFHKDLQSVLFTDSPHPSSQETSSNHGPSYSPALPALLPQRPRPTTALLTALLSPPFFPKDLVPPRPFLQPCSPNPSSPETSSHNGPSYSPALPTLLSQRPRPTTALLTALLSTPFLPQRPRPATALLTALLSTPFLPQRPRPAMALLTALLFPPFFPRHLVPPWPFLQPCSPHPSSPETSSHHGLSYSPALPTLLPQRPRPTTTLLTKLQPPPPYLHSLLCLPLL